jgi:hypothetical protein
VLAAMARLMVNYNEVLQLLVIVQSLRLNDRLALRNATKKKEIIF